MIGVEKQGVDVESFMSDRNVWMDFFQQSKAIFSKLFLYCFSRHSSAAAWNQFSDFQFHYVYLGDRHAFLRRTQRRWNRRRAETENNQFGVEWIRGKQFIADLGRVTSTSSTISRHWRLANCSRKALAGKSKIKRNEKFCSAVGAPDTKEIKNFMRIGSSKSEEPPPASSMLWHCLAVKNKHKAPSSSLLFSQGDAFSIVIVDGSSWVKFFFVSISLLWKHKIMTEDSPFTVLEYA